MYAELFNDCLSQGRSYRNLDIATNYVVSRIVNDDFLSGSGKEINYRHGYLKKTLLKIRNL